MNRIGTSIIAGGIIVAISLGSGIRVLKEGNVGLIKAGGRVVSTQQTAGMKLVAPFGIGGLEVIDVRVQVFELYGLTAAAEGQQDVILDMKLNYRVEADKAEELFKTVGKEYVDKLFHNDSIQHTVKSVTQGYRAEEMTSNRNEIAKSIKEILNEDLNVYGIVIDSVNIGNFDFDGKYNELIEEKALIDQQIQAEEKRAELVRAQGDVEIARIQKADEIKHQERTVAITEADTQIQLARKEEERRKIDARAEAAAYGIISGSIDEEVLAYQALKNEEKAIAKWDSKLPLYYGGGALPLIGIGGEQSTLTEDGTTPSARRR